MADTYDLKTIQATIYRTMGKQVTLSRLKQELELVEWVPEVGRMIVVADAEADLATSKRFGLFEGMTARNQYKISTGTAQFARLMTQAEIAACY
jgi:hypothetical protein